MGDSHARPLGVILSLSLLLGITYSIVIPIFETPDELQHYAHVNYVAQHGSFPPLGAPGEFLWDQQALQAPLFYWAAAALTAWVEASDLPTQAVLQPKANIGDATLPGKKNAFVHGPAQAFPYRGTTLAVHICRWLSVLLGVGTVAVTYILGRLALPVAHKDHALLGAGALAFIPQFVFIHASCSNDSAITFTSSLTLWLLVRQQGRPATALSASALGAAAGLMALSKLTGTVLAALALLLLLLITRKAWPVLIALATFALTAGWWYARNELVYGDPLALGAFLGFVGGNLDIPRMTLEGIWDQFRLVRFSTWGLFGHISILMEPVWLYLVFDLLALAGLSAAGVWALGQYGLPARAHGGYSGVYRFAQAHAPVLILALWLLSVLAVGARWFVAAGLQGRLLFPGLPAGAVLWALGIGFLGRRIPARALVLAGTAPLAGLALAVAPLVLWPAYAPPPVTASVPAAASPLDIHFGERVALRGYTIGREAHLLKFTFYWEARRQPDVDYYAAIRLVRPDGSFWLDYVNYPGMGTSLPTTWKAGELRQDELVFDVNRFPPETGPLHLIVGWFDNRRGEMEPVSNWAQIDEPGWATLTEVHIANP